MQTTQTYSIKDLLKLSNAVDTIVKLNGWVRSKRDSKAGFSFITLNDGSCLSGIQVVAPNTLANYTSQILNLTKDCSISVIGKVVASPGANQAVEIQATTVEVVGMVENPDTYPISPKPHSVEFLREVAHLRVRTNLISSVMRIRNTVSFAVHKYLQEQGFIWVHTPIITSSDCEGAGDLFRVTHFDLSNPPRNEQGKIDYKQDFFGKETYLTVSGQLNAESYCLAMSKVYTFGPTFRAENSNTPRHMAEFWMVEPEIAFANLMDNAKLATDLLKYLFKTVLDNHQEEMQFFAKFVDSNVLTRLEAIVNQDFAYMTYAEAIEHLLKSNKKFENPVSYGIDLASEHERWLCEEFVGRPTIVTDYPKNFKAFYMRLNDDGKTVAAMDILAPGIGEIVGGSQREERYDVLVKRMDELGLDKNLLSWYLDLRRFGGVPHSGFGMGLERVISYITGVANIRDVIPFPRSPKNAYF